MSSVLEAYKVDGAMVQDLRERCLHLNAGEGGRLRNFAQTLHQVSPEGFPETNLWQRFDSLLVQLGQSLREYFPDLAEDDDEDGWKRLAVAYAYGASQEKEHVDA